VGLIEQSRPDAWSRYRETWRSRDVAEQMTRRADNLLSAPDGVPQFRTFLQLLPAIATAEDLPSPARFLDIGCGVGGYADLLEQYAPGRFEYVGADFSDEILEAARRRAPARRFERRDVLQPGAVDGTDVLFASALLDVMPEPEAILSALLGSDATYVFLHRQRIAARGRVQIVPGFEGQRTYSTRVTLQQLRETAERHGRDVVGEACVEGNIWSFVLRRR
jgi:SAM-dependent methyltransferase